MIRVLLVGDGPDPPDLGEDVEVRRVAACETLDAADEAPAPDAHAGAVRGVGAHTALPEADAALVRDADAYAALVAAAPDLPVAILTGDAAADAAHVALALGLARASAAVQERDEFIAIAAHELKTPMTSVLGFAQMLRRWTSGTMDPTRIANAAGSIERQTRRLARLVGLLLELSRLDAGRIELLREEADLVPLVAGAVAATEQTTKQHTFELRAPPELRANVDPLRIDEVVMNLLDNAVKYSPEGGPIDVELARADGTVRVAVRDRGIGVPRKHRERIFERFERAHGRAHASGLGIGLYVSREIARLHGGDIVLENPPDGGARFVVTLPA